VTSFAKTFAKNSKNRILQYVATTPKLQYATKQVFCLNKKHILANNLELFAEENELFMKEQLRCNVNFSSVSEVCLLCEWGVVGGWDEGGGGGGGCVCVCVL
jgi:hypothetical protein